MIPGDGRLVGAVVEVDDHLGDAAGRERLAEQGPGGLGVVRAPGAAACRGRAPGTPSGMTVSSGAATPKYTALTIASRSMAAAIAWRNRTSAKRGSARLKPKNSSAWNGTKPSTP